MEKQRARERDTHTEPEPKKRLRVRKRASSFRRPLPLHAWFIISTKTRPPAIRTLQRRGFAPSLRRSQARQAPTTHARLSSAPPIFVLPGPRGLTIRGISAASKAQISTNKKGAPPSVRLFGTKAQVAEAKRLVELELAQDAQRLAKQKALAAAAKQRRADEAKAREEEREAAKQEAKRRREELKRLKEEAAEERRQQREKAKAEARGGRVGWSLCRVCWAAFWSSEVNSDSGRDVVVSNQR